MCQLIVPFSAPILVGFESSTHTTSESDGMVEVAIVVTGGAPRPLSVSLRTENNTACECFKYPFQCEIVYWYCHILFSIIFLQLKWKIIHQ